MPGWTVAGVPIELPPGITRRLLAVRNMDHQKTIPSQLGPASTIPAALAPSSRLTASESESSGIGGLLLKLLLLAVTVGLTLYFAG